MIKSLKDNKKPIDVKIINSNPNEPRISKINNKYTDKQKFRQYKSTIENKLKDKIKIDENDYKTNYIIKKLIQSAEIKDEIGTTLLQSSLFRRKTRNPKDNIQERMLEVLREKNLETADLAASVLQAKIKRLFDTDKYQTKLIAGDIIRKALFKTIPKKVIIKGIEEPKEFRMATEEEKQNITQKGLEKYKDLLSNPSSLSFKDQFLKESKAREETIKASIAESKRKQLERQQKQKEEMAIKMQKRKELRIEKKRQAREAAGEVINEIIDKAVDTGEKDLNLKKMNEVENVINDIIDDAVKKGISNKREKNRVKNQVEAILDTIINQSVDKAELKVIKEKEAKQTAKDIINDIIDNSFDTALKKELAVVPIQRTFRNYINTKKQKEMEEVANRAKRLALMENITSEEINNYVQDEITQIIKEAKDEVFKEQQLQKEIQDFMNKRSINKIQKMVKNKLEIKRQEDLKERQSNEVINQLIDEEIDITSKEIAKIVLQEDEDRTVNDIKKLQRYLETIDYQKEKEKILSAYKVNDRDREDILNEIITIDNLKKEYDFYLKKYDIKNKQKELEDERNKSFLFRNNKKIKELEGDLKALEKKGFVIADEDVFENRKTLLQLELMNTDPETIQKNKDKIKSKFTELYDNYESIALRGGSYETKLQKVKDFYQQWGDEMKKYTKDDLDAIYDSKDGYEDTKKIYEDANKDIKYYEKEIKKEIDAEQKRIYEIEKEIYETSHNFFKEYKDRNYDDYSTDTNLQFYYDHFEKMEKLKKKYPDEKFEIYFNYYEKNKILYLQEVEKLEDLKERQQEKERKEAEELLKERQRINPPPKAPKSRSPTPPQKSRTPTPPQKSRTPERSSREATPPPPIPRTPTPPDDDEDTPTKRGRGRPKGTTKEVMAARRAQEESEGTAKTSYMTKEQEQKMMRKIEMKQEIEDNLEKAKKELKKYKEILDENRKKRDKTDDKEKKKKYQQRIDNAKSWLKATEKTIDKFLKALEK